MSKQIRMAKPLVLPQKREFLLALINVYVIAVHPVRSTWENFLTNARIRKNFTEKKRENFSFCVKLKKCDFASVQLFSGLSLSYYAKGSRRRQQ